MILVEVAKLGKKVVVDELERRMLRGELNERECGIEVVEELERRMSDCDKVCA